MRYDHFQNDTEVLLTTAKEFLHLLIQCLLNLVCFGSKSSLVCTQVRPTKTITFGDSSIAVGCERLKKTGFWACSRRRPRVSS